VVVGAAPQASPASVQAPAEKPVPDSAAHLQLLVPEHADVVIDGNKIAQSGKVREIVSPTLQPATRYTYRISVRYSDGKGQPVDDTREIRFHANDWLQSTSPARAPARRCRAAGALDTASGPVAGKVSLRSAENATLHGAAPPSKRARLAQRSQPAISFLAFSARRVLQALAVIVKFIPKKQETPLAIGTSGPLSEFSSRLRTTETASRPAAPPRICRDWSHRSPVYLERRG